MLHRCHRSNRWHALYCADQSSERDHGDSIAGHALYGFLYDEIYCYRLIENAHSGGDHGGGPRRRHHDSANYEAVDALLSGYYHGCEARKSCCNGANLADGGALLDGADGNRHDSSCGVFPRGGVHHVPPLGHETQDDIARRFPKTKFVVVAFILCCVVSMFCGEGSTDLTD